jgi:CorA-like Mg2+ transporter protein
MDHSSTKYPLGFLELNVWRLEQDRFTRVEDHGGAGARGGAITWVDFVPAADNEAVATTLESMGLPGFDRTMLGYLLLAVGPGDYGAADAPWHDAEVAARLAAGETTRYLHAFALRPEIAIGPLAASEELPMVYRRDVHFLVSDSWLITRRRRGMAVTRGFFDEERDAISFDVLRRFAEQRWHGYHEPPDAATVVLRALADTWLPAIEPVSARLANAELLYVRGLDDDRALLDDRDYRRDLVDVKWIVDGLSSAFVALRRPGVPAETAWFRTAAAGEVAGEVERLLTLALDELGRHREQVRQSFDLIASTQTSRQIELANAERRRGERLERVVTFITTVLLGPALIATIFGALPDALHKRFALRLWLLIGLMIVAAVATYLTLLALRRREQQVDADRGEETPPRRRLLGGRPSR